MDTCPSEDGEDVSSSTLLQDDNVRKTKELLDSNTVYPSVHVAFRHRGVGGEFIQLTKLRRHYV